MAKVILGTTISLDGFINDIAENDKVDEEAHKDLIRAAVDFNVSGGKKK